MPVLKQLLPLQRKPQLLLQLRHLPLLRLLLLKLQQLRKYLKFGAVLNMSSPRGLQDKKWYDLFAKLYNDAGGWKIGNDTYKVQIVTYDSQGNATTAKD